MLAPKHPIPWHAAGNRELGDSAGNVVQYTQDSLGAICLAVNAHDKMRDALMQVSKLLGSEDFDISYLRRALDIINAALGKIGFAALSSALEAAQAPSGDLDRAIANELQRPQMAFTASLDAAMTLIPAGWRVGWSAMTTITAPDSPAIAPAMIVELTSPDGTKTVKATNGSVALAICAASLMAFEG
jgi:hypothetical protein